MYKTRKVLLAFKFLSKKRTGVGQYEKRELREFYKAWDEKKNPIDIVCRYDGTTYALINGEKKKMILKDYKNNEISKHQSLIKSNGIKIAGIEYINTNKNFTVYTVFLKIFF